MNAPGELSCRNCGVAYGPDDIFCESCGYDFITGSLPSAAEAAQLAPSASDLSLSPGGVAPGSDGPRPAGPSGSGSAQLRFDVSADRTYFDAVVSVGELQFPDPVPEAKQIDLETMEIHIGRTSQSRAIHPDLDIAELTGDPAVSSRHAVVRVASDGSLTVTDIGSTNGTIVGPVDGEAIKAGEAVPLDSGSSVYLGAWTRLHITVLSAPRRPVDPAH